MEAPKSIIQWVVGIVLGSVLWMAADSYLTTKSQAATAREANAAQETELALIRLEIEHLKRADEWQSRALRALLQDRGLPEP